MIVLNDLLHLPVPLILASQSPRRQSLMRHVGFVFTSLVPSIDEDAVDTSMPPAEYVQELAWRKARRGAEMVSGNAIIIGSDTTVVLDDQVLNKPVDSDDAIAMLRLLSGRTHTVHTGLALVGKGMGLTSRRASRATNVTFRELSDDEIRAYVATGSPLDKAGAYGIQDDFGAVFVSRVEGCYYTIVGLPLELLYTELRELVAASRHA